jgi:ribosomal protein L31E
LENLRSELEITKITLQLTRDVWQREEKFISLVRSFVQTNSKFGMIIINYVRDVARHESGATRALEVIRAFAQRQLVAGAVAKFCVFAIILFPCRFKCVFYNVRKKKVA